MTINQTRSVGTFQTTESTVITVARPRIHELANGKLPATVVGEKDDRGRRRTGRPRGTVAETYSSRVPGPVPHLSGHPQRKPLGRLLKRLQSLKAVQGSNIRDTMPAWTPTCDVVGRGHHVTTVRV